METVTAEIGHDNAAGWICELLLCSQDTVKAICGKIDKKRERIASVILRLFEKFAALCKEVPFCQALLLLHKDPSTEVTHPGVVTSIQREDVHTGNQ